MMSVLSAAVLSWGLSQFDAIETVEISTVEEAEAGQPSNWLLVGTDSRDGITEGDRDAGVFIGGDPSELPSGKRTDTMIVARVDPGNQTIDLLSLPRDLYVPIAGTGTEGRINTAFNAENGEQRLVDTVEGYLGIEINHYAEINFVGFRDIVDELGGVPMWFDKPMRDANSGLNIQNAGCHILQGSEALAFARSRHLQYFEGGSWHSDGTADLGRTTRQQYFLRRVVDTAAAKIDLTSLRKINSIIGVGGQNLVIDEGVEPGDLLLLAKTFAEVGGDRVWGPSLTIIDFRTASGAAVLGLKVEEAQPTLNIFRGLAPTPGGGVTTPTTVPVILSTSVFNASGVAGRAAAVAAAMEEADFEVVEVGNAQARGQTIVRYSSEQAVAASELIGYLAIDPLVEIDENVESVVLVIGADFAGLAPAQRPLTTLAAPLAPEATTTTTAPEETKQIGVVPGPTPEGTACS